jgi:serine/threonine protein kinase
VGREPTAGDHDDLGDETLAATGAVRRPGPVPTLARGSTVGRYVVLSQIGAGGMGVVYAAYDPELDRKIALKLLRPTGLGGDHTFGRARLMREVQAMAKVAHPNVVAVHDVGSWEDQVFIAMEFVEGRTLTEWMAAPHSLPEIVQVFVQAGRGLEAAHAKGLIHRDFKPDNALVGDDGRVRVMDFGLARPEDGGDEDVRGDTKEVPNVDALSTPLTQDGAVVGTPAYMAPEQHRGDPTDAR